MLKHLLNSPKKQMLDCINTKHVYTGVRKGALFSLCKKFTMDVPSKDVKKQNKMFYKILKENISKV